MLRSIMSAATHAYFNQENFNDREILSGIFASLNVSLRRANVEKECVAYVHMGVDAAALVKRYGREVLVLFKMLLAGAKIILFNDFPIQQVCGDVLALCSLIPGGLTHFSSTLLEEAKMVIPQPDVANASDISRDIDWGKLGLPLLPFSNSEVVSKYWNDVTGERAHKKFLLFPFASLHSLDELKAADGYILGCSNKLFASLPAENCHVLVHEDARVEVKPGYEKVGELSSQDKRFIANVVETVASHAGDGSYVGSDGWVREEFRDYLAALLSCCGHTEYIFDSNPKAFEISSDLKEFGTHFVHQFVHTAVFARWIHSVDESYVMIGDIIPHPSGPPCDSLDHIADQASEINQNLNEFKEKAKKKFSEIFLTPSSEVEHEPVISSPIVEGELISGLDAPQTAAPPKEESESLSSKFKNWWGSEKK
jgi:hypothetical protein